MGRSIRAHRISLALFLAVFVGAPLPAAAALVQLSDLFVFGDSLSDSGNSGLLSQAAAGQTFPPSPYVGGRYSNGPTAVEYLWNAAGTGDAGAFRPSLAGGTNYAIGGATTGSESFNEVNPGVPAGLQPVFADYGMARQLQQFLADPVAFDASTSLFVVWAFANDVFYAGQTGTLPGTVPGSPGGANVVENGIANIVATVGTLAASGARHFLVPNLPDLGRTPAFLGDASLSGLSAAFNENLRAQLTLLEASLPIEIVQFDIPALMATILDDPLAFGFTNTTQACVENLLNGLCDPGTWLFWDGVHPTTAAHRVIASSFRAAIPEPAPWASIALALGLLAFGRKRPSLRRRVTAVLPARTA